ncbi:MAG: glycosyltransferase family 2 protein [Spirulinaceae cyanobacterium RM2_2_10]|nr:glycosyltransferase family 2 protein [Spirulinaceae cyanobacterium SM2_1_0]NJO19151.1 glycosyltransferase family 2 protein [Spirulinaceae cyanobacterium RM2_2_10]
MTADYPLTSVLAIAPVRNEATTIAAVIHDLRAQGLQHIRIVDNGSTDDSAAIARAAGAEVVSEPQPGYGQACWRGLQDLPDEIEWILFCDGDGSDDLRELPRFWAEMAKYDLILGDRSASAAGRAAMTPVQHFGNQLSATLIRWGWGHRYHDLGPLRLIRRSALAALEMRDRGFGWTVEMQVRAVECNLRSCELPVSYHPRQGGRSKISGTVSGSLRAGWTILDTIGQLYWRRERPGRDRLVLAVITLLYLSGCLLLHANERVGEFRDFGDPSVWWRFGLGVGLLGTGFMLSWCLPRLPGRWFWLLAIATRGILLFKYPHSDLWRYLWEGHIQTLGFNPYWLPPDAIDLIPYRTSWWEQINTDDTSAIYPPLSQLIFRGLASLSLSVTNFKLAFIVADLGICWLLVRLLGTSAASLYAWNPLVLHSIAAGGHYDSLYLLPLVAAWWVYERRSPPLRQRTTLAALLVGCSIGIKWVSLPVLGFLVWETGRRRRWGLALMTGLVGLLPVALATLPYCTLDRCTLAPVESGFVQYWRVAELVPYLLSQVWAFAAENNWIYAIPLAIACLLLAIASRSFLHFTARYHLVLLTLSPIVHAWYFTWLMPFAAGTGNWGGRWLSLSGFVYFTIRHRIAMGLTWPDWRLSPGERFLLWAPLLIGWFWSEWRDRDRWLKSRAELDSEPQFHKGIAIAEDKKSA